MTASNPNNTPRQPGLSALQIGLLAALAGNIMWSLFPFYFRPLTGINPLEILDHRVWGSVVFLAFWLPFNKRWATVTATLRDFKTARYLLLSAALIGGNWLVYIWAVTHDNVLQASLGYYLSPLVAVALSWAILKEKQNRFQFVAFILASLAVGAKIIMTGSLPWVALALGFSFASYGLVRKRTDVGPMSGLFIEALFLLPLALGHLAWLASQNALTVQVGLVWPQPLLILGLGVVTAMPLYFFNTGAKALPLSFVSMLFYTVPTLLFFFATQIFGEPATRADVLVFAVIWLAVGLYLYGQFQSKRPRKPNPRAA